MPETERLQNSDPFPSLTAPRADGGTMRLPDDAEGRWSLVIFYRGDW